MKPWWAKRVRTFARNQPILSTDSDDRHTSASAPTSIGSVGERSRWSALLDMVLPPVCSFCQQSLDDTSVPPWLCGECHLGLTSRRSPPICGFCGANLPPADAHDPTADRAPHADPAKCPRCQRRRWPFDQICWLGRYEGTLRQAVVRMKQRHELPLSRAVGQLLANRLAVDLAKPGEIWPEIVVPIPKYWLKQWIRGHNSAETLGEVISRELGCPLNPTVLTCNRSSRKQSLLGRTERRNNVEGLFRLRSKRRIDASHALIVDDIMTTGATAIEAARLLRRAGARRVTVAVVARTATRPVEGKWRTGRQSTE